MVSHLLRARFACGARSKPLLSHVRLPRTFATLASLENQYAEGTKLHGYTVKRTKQVPELELLAVHLQHDKTGGEHLHVARDDKNNVFSIAFKTNPPDATGVAHILEHTTLCGSEKYPVRDPFFKMLNRSLSNFMNAMTASDYTFYPFATTNVVDFGNLREVYLDATLHPLLRQLDFTQEGWRLEHTDPNDPTSPLTFKGVVYNEMKGQMSDSSYLYYIRFQESIYPSLNNSGGDPAKITDLTYNQLREFHAKNYHPSNSKVFTYGSFPLEEHLQHIDNTFSKFDLKTREIDVKYPIELNETKRVVVEGPIDPLADPARQYKTSLTWFMGPTDDVYEGLCLRVVTTLLTDGHASPLYQALIESDLGTEYSPNTGLDTSSPVNIFSVGLQGVKKEDLPVVEQTIRSAIQKTYDEGLDLNRVEAILHQTELSRKHKVANFGMNLLYSLTPGWFNKVDPLDMFEWNSVINRFREDLKKPRFLESFLEKYLLDDEPSFSFSMVPSESYGETLRLEEQQRLSAKTANLTEEDKQEAYDLGLKLLQKQEEKEDLSCLPTLHVKDIPLVFEIDEIEHSMTSANVPVQWRVTPTNGLTYFRALASLQDLPQHLHPYLPLFAESLTNLGTKTRSMASLEDEIKLKTGGISASVQVNTVATDMDTWKLGLMLTGYSLDKDVSELFRLMAVLLLETNYDNHEKLRTLIRGMTSGAADAIAGSGHAYARGVAASATTASSRLSESLAGMEQVKFMAYLDSYDDASLPLISAKLKEIAVFAISNGALKVAITCGADAVAVNEHAVAEFVDSLPAATTPRSVEPGTASTLTGFMPNALPQKTFYPMPFQVNYAGVCLRGVPYTHSDSAALQILANLLTHKYLHGEIREKGGAYGGGATYSGAGGIFSYYSYRDPNPLNTLTTVSRAGEWAVQNTWSARDLEEAKLSVFQGIDAPQSVASEGMIYFLHGFDDYMRQARRSQLLDVGIADIKDAAERYLVGKDSETSVALLGTKQEWISNENKWRIADAGPLSLAAAAAIAEAQLGAEEDSEVPLGFKEVADHSDEESLGN
ncbi:peptidase M16C associated-domain-containing protein [Lipomyces tetrasporus]|uniref:Presequence protease, mitochondrial n=1 Tax=Lipomyces tetrasporus TaxID=54092 RepID=A0AAD7VQ62_9ASCO|nr:peptidase M16C associated-domain-containing protein [Lipomyces tetrasporus]KAJ8096805.1 peptidase M16C associated-domain-containing protein [Lipomyces tetrasporus]